MDGAYDSIDSYLPLGCMKTVALLGTNGRIDWLCVPRFDSPSVFAGILDRNQGGHFTVAVDSIFSCRSTYVADTNIVETVFESDNAVVKVSDFMCSADQAMAPIYLVRKIECLSGEESMRLIYSPRPNYARQLPRFYFEREGLVRITLPEGELYLEAIGWQLSESSNDLLGTKRIHQGEVAWLVLEWVRAGEQFARPDWQSLYEQTRVFWQNWIGKISYRGAYSDVIRRSALVLKLLTYKPTGAIVAAGTTSLPEVIGGSRNWDYRYCWLRDSSLALDSMFSLGFYDEGHKYFHWLWETHAKQKRDFQIMYRIDGGKDIEEYELPHLDGYKSSRPVRVGNAAAKQLQLDIYGELIEAAYVYRSHGFMLDMVEKELVRYMLDEVISKWRLPDNGIWEVRAGTKHYVYSKLMCWCALDRGIKLATDLGVEDKIDAYAAVRNEIAESIYKYGWNEEKGAFTQYFGSNALDASVLVMPQIGFTKADDPKFVSTVEAIQKELVENGMVYRYKGEDGLEGAEGTFTLCTFWLVSALCLMGRESQAVEIFEATIKRAAQHLIFSEEFDPKTNEALGNYPQAFTHIALISAALDLQCMRAGRLTEPRRIQLKNEDYWRILSRPDT